MSTPENVRTLPVLPIKNAALFPMMLLPLTVGRASSIAAIEAALATEEKEIVVVAQRDASVEEPNLSGSLCHRHQSGPQEDGAQAR